MRELAEGSTARAARRGLRTTETSPRASPLDPANRGQYADKLWKIGQSAQAVEQASAPSSIRATIRRGACSASGAKRMDKPEEVTAFAREELSQRRPGDRTWLARCGSSTTQPKPKKSSRPSTACWRPSPRNPEARLEGRAADGTGALLTRPDRPWPPPRARSRPMILQGRAAWVESRAGRGDAPSR